MALVVYGGYYLSFRLPVGAQLLRSLVQIELRTACSRPGESIRIPYAIYLRARKVAHVAILNHRNAMWLPAPPPPAKGPRPFQLRLL